MGLLDLFSGWGRRRERKRDIEATAQAILTRYQLGKKQGRLRVDDQLLADLQQRMPVTVAARVFEDFRTRRSHEHPQADGFLLHDMVHAMHDVEHFAKTAKPIQGPAQAPGDYRGMTRKERPRPRCCAGSR